MATTKQTRMIAGRMVEFQDKFGELTVEEAQFVIQNAGEAIDMFIAEIKQKALKSNPSKLFSGVLASTVLQRAEKRDYFYCSDYFFVGVNADGVRISYMNYEFELIFSRLAVKTTESEEKFYKRELLRPASHDAIIHAHGKVPYFPNLWRIYQLILLQPRGEQGFLDLERKNIFYTKFIKDIFQVDIEWSNGGWAFFAEKCTSLAPTVSKGGMVISYHDIIAEDKILES